MYTDTLTYCSSTHMPCLSENKCCSAKALLYLLPGPYTILRKMGPVMYKVHHLDKGKESQVYHLNLIKGC